MPLFEDSWRLPEAQSLGGKDRRGIARTVRRKNVQGLMEIPGEVLERDLCVNPQGRLEVFGREHPAGIRFESDLEVGNAAGGQRKASRLGVTAVALKQTAAVSEGFQKMEFRDRPSRSLAGSVLDADHECRAVVALGDALDRKST